MPPPNPPNGILHHEDLVVGETIDLPTRRVVTKDEIIAFARSYDPQFMHVDEEAAKRSMVGGLCASGFHSCAILMRILVDDLLGRMASLGAPGVDEAKWLKPVRPGDVLRARCTITEKRVLASRPDVGASRFTCDLVNQDGDTAMTWTSHQFSRRRNRGHATTRPKPEGQRSKSAPLSVFDVADAPAPSRTSNYFEDRRIGEIYDLGRHTFTRDEIIAFAREFDPQPFHLDDEAGRKSLFGGLSASGWHTAAIFVRQNVAWRQKLETEIAASGANVAQWGPSPGFKGLSWLKPVYPGDTLGFRGQTTDLIASRSRPDRGLIVTNTEAQNQHGDVVFRITSQLFAERRHSASAR